MRVIYITEVKKLWGGAYRKLSNIAGTQYIDIAIEELAPEITERMALLRLAPVNNAVKDIGKRLEDDRFYLYFPDDFDLTRLRPQGGEA